MFGHLTGRIYRSNVPLMGVHFPIRHIAKMCEDCVKEEYPERETMCLETGSYLMNFSCCSNCGKRESINNVEREEIEDESGEEHITYQHACRSCHHIIAQHEYTFKVEDGYQLYEMSCLLCGMGEDQRSVMPVDPSKSTMLW